MEINKQVSSRIQQVREERRIKLGAVAKAISLSPSAYSRIEKGETQITVENLFKIANALEVPVQQLLSLKDSQVFGGAHKGLIQQGNNTSITISLSEEQANAIIEALKS
jgi:transcriptional regulator with XRE-family HTH domain